MKAQSQRQLRAGELVRRALSDIIAEGHLHDPHLKGVSVTVTEVRMSPDLKHASCFIAALGRTDLENVAGALNHASGFLQKELSGEIEMKFTPRLKFLPDESFDEAGRVDEILNRPSVQRDLDPGEH